MKITFHFPDDPITLDIVLRDNPAVKSWSEHFLTQGYQADSHRETPFLTWEYDDVLLQEYVDILNNRVAELAQTGYKYPGLMPTKLNDITRNWTNTLHRFFTHTQRAVHDMVKPVDSDDEELKLIQTHATRLLQDINEYVHRVERYMPHEVEEVSMNEIYISHEPEFDKMGWWKLLPEWRQYHSRAHADVILGSQILGKTIIKSYLDGDNPNDWDTTGHYSNFGAIQLQFGPTVRQDIYNSLDFISWLNRWGLDYETAWFDFPIGNIINKEMIPVILDKFSSPEIKNYATVTVAKRS